MLLVPLFEVHGFYRIYGVGSNELYLLYLVEVEVLVKPPAAMLAEGRILMALPLGFLQFNALNVTTIVNGERVTYYHVHDFFVHPMIP